MKDAEGGWWVRMFSSSFHWIICSVKTLPAPLGLWLIILTLLGSPGKARYVHLPSTCLWSLGPFDVSGGGTSLGFGQPCGQQLTGHRAWWSLEIQVPPPCLSYPKRRLWRQTSRDRDPSTAFNDNAPSASEPQTPNCRESRQQRHACGFLERQKREKEKKKKTMKEMVLFSVSLIKTRQVSL